MLTRKITLAITGGSGAQYALRLLQQLLKQPNIFIHGLISNAAHQVFKYELNIDLPSANHIEQLNNYFYQKYATDQQKLKLYQLNDWMSPIASGSSVADAMVICPCSVGSLAAIANGISNNLINRAADVTIKEQKKLILVVRETPFSSIHLENMLKLSRLGTVILPANPGYYNHPQTIDDLIDFIVARILQQLDIPQDLQPAFG